MFQRLKNEIRFIIASKGLRLKEKKNWYEYYVRFGTELQEVPRSNEGVNVKRKWRSIKEELLSNCCTVFSGVEMVRERPEELKLSEERVKIIGRYGEKVTLKQGKKISHDDMFFDTAY